MAVALVPFSESKDAITIGLTAAGVKRAPRELPPAQSTSKPSLLCVRETETSRKFGLYITYSGHQVHGDTTQSRFSFLFGKGALGVREGLDVGNRWQLCHPNIRTLQGILEVK